MKREKKLFVMALSFKKADVVTRGKYSFFPEQVAGFVAKAKEQNINSLYVLSTCNRTEFYAFAYSSQEMIDLYAQQTQAEGRGGEARDLEEYVEILEGKEAVRHLIRVTCGLESQILGDFEIVSQIKLWFNRFKKQGAINGYLDRLISTAIQISKKVKNQTSLSDGAASVSFAAVNYILKNHSAMANQTILLYGLGKIGRNTCENLVKHTQNDQIVLINRTEEKAQELAEKYQVKVKGLHQLREQLMNTDILIVATGASKETVTAEMIPKDKTMCIIDLSIPSNVEANLGNRPNIDLIGVDRLSGMVDDTLGQRMKEIPKVEKIIDESLLDLEEWLLNRRYAKNIAAFKNKLEVLQARESKEIKKKSKLEELDKELSDRMIQKLTNRYARFILDNKEEAEQTTKLMDQMFGLDIEVHG